MYNQFLILNWIILNFRYYVRDGDASLKDGCDSSCKNELACKVATTISLQSPVEHCNEM